ncbi:unnamed protein product [Caenorhabditis angaria]|uniref:DUF38 domain-containing protein n=1 Tax=Caenorhabditis angaria TaxID=860376 RepID=A0A9P1N144_9PELO|nr:unnamed protein product [Caenorhabditis angaria]
MNCLQVFVFSIFVLISGGFSADTALESFVNDLELHITQAIKIGDRNALLHRFKSDYEYLDCQNQKLNREQVVDSLLGRKKDLPFIRLSKVQRISADPAKFYFIMEYRFDKSGGKFAWNSTVEYFKDVHVFTQSKELGCCSV